MPGLNDVCCGCGVCAAICPTNCIKMAFDEYQNYMALVDENLCKKCGLCRKICPQNKVETSCRLNPSDSQPFMSGSLGAFSDSFVGFTNNVDERKKSASGGLLTVLLSAILQKKIVDAIISVGPSSYTSTGKYFETKIFSNIEDLNSNRGTKYYPVEYSTVLKNVQKEKNSTFAIVALPCVALAIRKAQQNGKLKNIKYVFSLFCGHGVSAAYTEYLLKSVKLPLESVEQIDYRDKTDTIKATDYTYRFQYSISGEVKSIKIGFISSKIHKIWDNYLFTPKSCLFCSDLSGEYSDASFSDAWLPEYAYETKGTSIVVIRNHEISQIFKQLQEEKKVTFTSISQEKIIQAQNTGLFFKKDADKRACFDSIHRKSLRHEKISSKEMILALRRNWKLFLMVKLSRWLYKKNLVSLLELIISHL